MLCHTTIWPAGSVAGFGEKDCAPFSRTTLIVTTPLGDVGTGVGVGVGATGLPPESLELLQPHAHRLNMTITLATITRMSFLFSTLAVSDLYEMQITRAVRRHLVTPRCPRRSWPHATTSIWPN